INQKGEMMNIFKKLIFCVVVLSFSSYLGGMQTSGTQGQVPEGSNYTLISADGISFEVSQKLINQSGTLKHMIADASENNTNIDLPINSTTLEKLIDVIQNPQKIAQLNEQDLIELANATDFL